MAANQTRPTTAYRRENRRMSSGGVSTESTSARPASHASALVSDASLRLGSTASGTPTAPETSKGPVPSPLVAASSTPPVSGSAVALGPDPALVPELLDVAAARVRVPAAPPSGHCHRVPARTVKAPTGPPDSCWGGLGARRESPELVQKVPAEGFQAAGDTQARKPSRPGCDWAARSTGAGSESAGAGPTSRASPGVGGPRAAFAPLRCPPRSAGRGRWSAAGAACR
jgi:hypothetical protein